MAELAARRYEAKIVDSGDLNPYLTSVEICVAADTHICTLAGYYSYAEDTPKCGVSPGRSEAVVLGVSFSKSILFSEESDIEIAGRDIEYDRGLSLSDVMDAAGKSISFVNYDQDLFGFDENGVSDSMLIECMETDCGLVFAVNGDGEVCAFEDDVDAQEAGCRVIDEGKAFEILAAKRPGIEFSPNC